MGALSSKGQAPFLTYLTIFKSRLGAVNIVLPLASLAYQPVPTLSRRLREKLSHVVEVNLKDAQVHPLFEYLVEKKLIGAGGRKSGRYADVSLTKTGSSWTAIDRSQSPLERLSVFQTDIWLADENIPSTVGVPTAENAEEVLELCFQLSVLSKTKCTWTSAGQLIQGLRMRTPSPSANPMLLGLEVVPVLRQIVEKDGLILRELLRHLMGLTGPVTRDAVALDFAGIAERAQEFAKGLRLPPPVLAEGKEFIGLLKRTTAKRAEASRAPGVLEHRVSPRLEWLTDLGALEKRGVPKNSFSYSSTSDARVLLALLDHAPGTPSWPDDVALGYWRGSQCLGPLRAKVSKLDLNGALRLGYAIMQRSVGPTAIRDVCLAAGVLAPGLSLSAEGFSASLLEWAKKESGITVSGGRYTRKPELIHMAPELLGEG